MDKCGICKKPATQLFETGNEGMYACFKCQPLVPEVTIGDSADQQSNHSQEENNDSGDSELHCGICNKTFQKSLQLQNHLRNHRAERRFVCTYCHKAFSQSNNLRAHLRIHTNERPYKCTECGKAFTQVTNLNNHVRLHTGERPFACPEPGCSKAFAQVTNLNQHRKRHLNGRPLETTYECNICGKQFDQRNHMYNHRREVHMTATKIPISSQHMCKICEQCFSSEKQLLKHVAEHVTGSQHHSSDEDEDNCRYACVFSVCSARFATARAHTDHLLQAHQLRVMTAPSAGDPPRRGRPPKVQKDPLDLKENGDYGEDEVQMIKKERFLPKIKLQSLFR